MMIGLLKNLISKVLHWSISVHTGTGERVWTHGIYFLTLYYLAGLLLFSNIDEIVFVEFDLLGENHN